MLNYIEANEILKKFDTKSYKDSQIGSSKSIIVSIYNYFLKLNISKDIIDEIVKNIAYFYKDTINIPLYLEILSKSLGFLDMYSLEEILNVVRDVHDIYFRDNLEITLEEYVHGVNENILRKLFLDRNGKYLNKNFGNDICLKYIGDLKFVAAMELSQKEYNEFINFIDDFVKYQSSYSPFKLFKVYLKLRKRLKGLTCIFWDIVYGNEYILSLFKSNIKINEIYSEKVHTSVKDIKCFQLFTIYYSKELPNFKYEEDLIKYYSKLIVKDRKNIVVLPKLKNDIGSKYVYKTN